MSNKLRFVLPLLLVLCVLFSACGKEKENNEEKETSVSYIDENLNASRYKNYQFIKTISFEGVLLLEENVKSELIDSQYIISTKITKLSLTSSSNIYDEEYKEERMKNLVNPVSLNLKEEYFESFKATEKAFTGKALDSKVFDLLAINNIESINLEIKLNDKLFVESIVISYVDVATNYEVNMSIKYSY